MRLLPVTAAFTSRNNAFHHPSEAVKSTPTRLAGTMQRDSARTGVYHRRPVMKNTLRLGFNSSPAIVASFAIAAGLASGSCKDYTCLDTATCSLLATDAGESSKSVSDSRGSSKGVESATYAPHHDSTERNNQTRSSNDDSQHDTSSVANATEADASVSSEGSGEALDDTFAPLDAGAATSRASETDTAFAISAARNTTDTGEDTSPPSSARCNPDEPFGRPFPVAAINLANEIETVAVSPDGLTAYIRYGSDPTMYQSTRDDVMVDFGSPQAYTAFDEILAEHGELFVRSITQGGLTAYLQEGSQSAGPIRSAHREEPSQVFGMLNTRAELVVEGLPIIDPWPSLDGKRLYGSVIAVYQLVVVEAGESGFGEAARVDDGTSLESGVYSSVLRPDELVVYSTVNRVGDKQVKGSGGIARGVRAAMPGEFDDWEYMEPLDSAGWDIPVWISDDECEIVLRQESGSGEAYTSDLFIARRAP